MVYRWSIDSVWIVYGESMKTVTTKNIPAVHFLPMSSVREHSIYVNNWDIFYLSYPFFKKSYKTINMKKTIHLSLLFTFLSIISLVNTTTAQDATKELTAFTKRFEEAFNKKDIKAIKEMFSKDAVRISAEGQTQTGNAAIVAAYEELFLNKLTVTITQEKVATENGSTVSSGTYHATGSTQSGESIDSKGSFVNTMIKEGGQWKISKQTLNSL